LWFENMPSSNPEFEAKNLSETFSPDLSNRSLDVELLDLGVLRVEVVAVDPRDLAPVSRESGLGPIL
jgi:hypothetical protein